MTFNRPVAGNTVLATDITQLTDMLQRQSTQTETGKYYLESGLYATNAFTSTYIRTSSQGSTPISVTIDEADQAHTGSINAPTTAQLTSFGFQIKANASGASTDGRVGGNYTVHY